MSDEEYSGTRRKIHTRFSQVRQLLSDDFGGEPTRYPVALFRRFKQEGREHGKPWD